MIRDQFRTNGHTFYDGQVFESIEEFYYKLVKNDAIYEDIDIFYDENMVHIENVVKENELCLVWLEEVNTKYVLHVLIENRSEFVLKSVAALGLIFGVDFSRYLRI